MRLLLLAALTFALFVTGCDKPKITPLTIGHNDWIGFQPLESAKNRGLLKGHIIPVEVPNNSELMRLFRNHLIDGIALTLDEAITLATQTDDCTIFMILDISHGADAVVANPSKITTLKDLKGKRVAFESTSVGAVMLHELLKYAKLGDQDIVPVNAYFHQHQKVYIHQEADAVITFEPIKSQLLKRGAKVIFDSSMIPDTIIDVLVVRKSLFLDQDDPRLHTLLSAWYEAVKYTPTDPKVAKSLNLTVEQLEKTYKDIIFPPKSHAYQILSQKLVDKTASLYQLMLRHNLIEEKNFAPHALLDLQWLQRYYR